VLEKVKVPQPLDLGIVHRMFACRVRMGEPPAGDEIHLNRQLPFRFIKIDTLDKPWRFNAKSGFKELTGHDWWWLSMADPSFCRSQPYSSILGSIFASRVRFAGLRPPLTRRLNPLKFQQRLFYLTHKNPCYGHAVSRQKKRKAYSFGCYMRNIITVLYDTIPAS
jgi:hypothetical protein